MPPTRKIALCSVEHCNRVGPIKRGMCYPCYQLWLKKNPSPTKLTAIGKTCTRCKQDKPLSEYNKTQRNKSGLEAHCRDCSVEHQAQWRKDNPDKGKEYNDRWVSRNPDYKQNERFGVEYKRSDYVKRGWNYNLVTKYGITSDEFYAMLESQGGGCAICGCQNSGAVGRVMSVDHCHKTGKVRGILCHPCNKGLGMFADDSARVAAAADYLIQHMNVLDM